MLAQHLMDNLTPSCQFHARAHDKLLAGRFVCPGSSVGISPAGIAAWINRACTRPQI